MHMPQFTDCTIRLDRQCSRQEFVPAAMAFMSVQDLSKRGAPPSTKSCMRCPVVRTGLAEHLSSKAEHLNAKAASTQCVHLMRNRAGWPPGIATPNPTLLCSTNMLTRVSSKRTFTRPKEIDAPETPPLALTPLDQNIPGTPPPQLIPLYGQQLSSVPPPLPLVVLEKDSTINSPPASEATFQPHALATAARVEDHTLQDRDLSQSLKETVIEYFQIVAENGSIDADGLLDLRTLLTRDLRIPQTAFGVMAEQFLRFDCDGDGRLNEHETLRLVKANLNEFIKPKGQSSSGDGIPRHSPATAGYSIIKEIGHGNQSKANLAKNHKDELCCIKTYQKVGMSNADIDSLKEEYDVLRSLPPHPNFPSALNIFQDSNLYYLVQELYTGGDFTTLRQQASGMEVRMDESWWIEIFRQSFVGLAHLHEHSFIHCDIKEPNLMLKTDRYFQPQVVIIDFGFVRSAASDKSTICGTPGYISPETWEKGKLFPGSDIFALGVVMMQMLLDKIPPHHNPPPCEVLPGGIFTEGAGTIALVMRSTRDRVPPFELLSATFPLLANVTQAVLAKDVSRRPCAKQVLNSCCFAPSAEGTSDHDKLAQSDHEEEHGREEPCQFVRAPSGDGAIDMVWTWLFQSDNKPLW